MLAQNIAVGKGNGGLYSVDWTRDWTVGLDSQKVALVISEGQKTGNCVTALYSCHRR